jgi:hypothetical protein
MKYVATFIPIIEVLLNDDLTIADYKIEWQDSYVVAKELETGKTIRGIDHDDIGGNARTFLNALGIEGYPKDKPFIGWSYAFGFKDRSEPF